MRRGSLSYKFMIHADYNLAAAARQEMIDHGFEPDFPPDAERQLAGIRLAPHPELRDLTALLWSSIDNDDSRDLDQIEWAERAPGGIRVLVGVADVDSAVRQGTPIDRSRARARPPRSTPASAPFPCCPSELSTDLTSLGENQDRAAIVIEMTVDADGQHSGRPRLPRLWCAIARSSPTAPWGPGWKARPVRRPKWPRPPIWRPSSSSRMKPRQALREARHRLGALTFDRVGSCRPVSSNGNVQDVTARASNRAAHLIEDFMIGANEVMARTLRDAGVSSIRRVVKAPERWNRMVELARQHGETLPPEPDCRRAQRRF